MLLETAVALFPSARRHIRLDGECWTWTGPCRRGVPTARPTVHIVPMPLRSTTAPRTLSDRPIRRVLFLIETNAKDLPDRVPDPSCGNRMCINPQHQQWRGRNAHLTSMET